MKLFFSILSIFATYNSSYGQREYIDKNYDCKLLTVWNPFFKNPSKIDTILLRVECYVIRDQFAYGINLLDSLIRTNPKEGKLFVLKAQYHYRHNIYDTVYFSCLREAINLNYDLGFSLGLTANLYYNYISATESPNSTFTLSNSKKNQLLELCEKNCLKSLPIYNERKDFILELLSLTKKKKADLNGQKIEELNLVSKFDTLTIVSQLMDCGEFGGHLEYIKCYHSNNDIVAEFSQDPPYCELGHKSENAPHIFKTGLQKISLAQLDTYVKHFNSINPNPHRMTNAPTSFWVMKDSNIYYIRDWSGNSKEFESLRDATFK